MSTLVGTLTSLWRYPVKSMLGESLTEADVTTKGVLGDRTYALWDTQTQRVASAKNPHKWARLLESRASFRERPTDDAPLPAVSIVLPNGTHLDSDHPDIASSLSAWLGRDVQFLVASPEAASVDKYCPDVPGTDGHGQITQLFLPEGTFFDSCSVHLLTTATLACLRALYPEGDFDVRRFRPNCLIKPIPPTSNKDGFIETDWVGTVLGIGDRVRLQIDSACPRCVVTTLAQPGLPKDLNILRTTATHNHVNAGIRASVLQGGEIRCGDPVVLNP